MDLNNEKGTCYQRLGTPLTHEAAMKSCRIWDSYLVEVNSEEESKWITENVLKNVSCRNEYFCAMWTGANDREEEDTFAWEHSNTRVGPLNWSPGNSDGSDPNKDCVDMFHNGQFNDRRCNHENVFMCERQGLP